MKQVLIKKMTGVKDLSFSQLTINSKESLTCKPGLNIFKLPFGVKTFNSEQLNFKFELTESVAQRGLMLAGAYQSKTSDKLTAMLYNFTNGPIAIKEKEALITAMAYESIRVRQIDLPPGAKMESKEAPKKKRERPKKSKTKKKS